MAEETRVASTVEELASRSTLDADSILKLRNAVRNSAAERKILQTRLNGLEAANLSRDEKAVRQAAFHLILGHYDQAEAALKGLPLALERLLAGELALERGAGEQAVALLEQAADLQPKSVKVVAELAAAQRCAGKPADGLKTLERVEKHADGDVLLQKAWCLEAAGRQEDACTAYEKALEVDPKNGQAIFRLAYYMDLRGEDTRAIELYRKVTGQGTSFVNAMINLALLYEDREEVDAAIACFKEALKADPTNRRAQLYLRDAVESLDMYYDESLRKESDRLEAVLRIPVNEFELSVRSRNCLSKMNVRTLGDMVRKTEPELLAYKNFGETSLREIKQLLESKGLHLGMHREEDQKRARSQRLRLGPAENTILAKPIAELELSVRARKCMQRLNIETLGELVDKTEADLLATKNFGQTSLNEVKIKLSELSLGLKAMD